MSWRGDERLRDGFSHAEVDLDARALREAQVDAERMLLATRSALVADAALLEADEQAGIAALMAALDAARNGNDRTAIEAATHALAEGTENFAALRMNQGIRQALSGRRLDEV